MVGGVQRGVWWSLGGAFMVGGAMWMMVTLWKTSPLAGDEYTPIVVGSFVAGLTCSRATVHPVRVAASAAALWVAMEVLVLAIHGPFALWGPADADLPWLHVGLLVAAPLVAAPIGASVRLPGRAEHPVLWVWISALVTLGCTLVTLVVAADGAVWRTLLAALVAGLITQVLAPMRRIWVCAGGAWILAVLFLQVQGVSMALSAGGVFWLSSALGATIGWRILRRGEPRAPAPQLPTATL